MYGGSITGNTSGERGGVVEDRVLLKLGADSLLQLLDRQFNQLDCLYLERRKLLLLLELETLSYLCHGPTCLILPVKLQEC